MFMISVVASLVLVIAFFLFLSSFDWLKVDGQKAIDVRKLHKLMKIHVILGRIVAALILTTLVLAQKTTYPNAFHITLLGGVAIIVLAFFTLILPPFLARNTIEVAQKVGGTV